jgi:hypothetical protein
MHSQDTAEFVKDARMVVLAFFIDDMLLKERANDIIDQHVDIAITQYHVQQPRLSIKARTQTALFELGTQYFKKYAKLNWDRLLNEKSRIRLARLSQENDTLEEIISKLRKNVKRGDNRAYLDLGHCLTLKIKSQKSLDNLKQQMYDLIESRLFTERMLPAVVQKFYEDFQETQTTKNPIHVKATAKAPFKRQAKNERRPLPSSPQKAELKRQPYAGTVSIPEGLHKTTPPVLHPIEKPKPNFSQEHSDTFLNPLFIEEKPETEEQYSEEELKRSRFKRLKKKLHSPFKKRRSIPPQRAPWRQTKDSDTAPTLVNKHSPTNKKPLNFSSF